MSSVRYVGGADYRFIFKNIKNAAIDTPRMIEEMYRQLHQIDIPKVFHDKEPGRIKPAKMDYRARLNIIS